MLALALAAAGPAGAAIDYEQVPRIQDLAVVPTQPGRLVLATGNGLLLGTSDGRVVPLALAGNDIAALAADPRDPAHLYAGGRDRDRDGLGLMASRDGGLQWQTVGPGATGPAFYRAIAASPDVPGLLYASYGGLQRSRDGGENWEIVGRGPWDVFSLAVAPGDGTTVYAAGRAGVYASTDGGANWRPAHPAPQVAGALTVGPDGDLWSFVIGRGLLRTSDPGKGWRTVANAFGEQVLMRLVLDPRDAHHLYALNHFGRVIESRDEGRTWSAFGGPRGPTTEAGRRGKALYQRYCQSCHGVDGVGETPTEAVLADPNYLRAIALDDTTHAWHHSDEDMVKSIMEGSPRAPRVPRFAGTIDPGGARDIVTYIKSLWGPKALRCQGAGHMSKECQ